MKSRRYTTIFKQVMLFTLLIIFTFANSGLTVNAISKQQQKLFNKGIYYFDYASCSTVQAAAADEDNSPVSDGQVAVLAKEILDNSNVVYYVNGAGINAKDVLTALSKGEKAYTTAPNATNKTADINVNILRFILDAARSGQVMVNALTDKTHSDGSNHYKGLAVDLDNGAANTTVKPEVLIKKARKYGGEKNSEGGHYHFDFLNPPGAQQDVLGAQTDNEDSSSQDETRRDPSSITFPDLQETAMANAVNKYIKDTKPNSKLKGSGQKLVASAKKANVNPFFVIAIAQKESQLADPSDYNVENANNAFGRTATESQPHHKGSRLWYKWSSVIASVDASAPENKDGNDVPSYLRDVYKNEFEKNDLTALMNRYAPPSENDTALYIKQVKQAMKKMTELTGDEDANTVTDPTTNCSCGGSSTPDDAELVGSNKTEKALNFFVANGYSKEQAAGIIGNFLQESSLNPKVVEQGPYDGGKTESDTVPAPIGPEGQPGYGIAQWTTPSRKTALSDFAKKEGKPVGTLSLQLSFVIEEMKDYAGLSEKIKAIKSGDVVTQAAFVFHDIYEGSADTIDQIGQRAQSGKDALGDFGSGSAAQASSGGGSECTSDEESGAITGEYAFPVSKKLYQQNPNYFTSPHHDYSAVDIPMTVGNKVYSMTSGTISLAPVEGACGTGVLINTDDGIEYVYCHGTDGGSIDGARQGDKVKPGQLIMHSGNTGSSQGPHLHIQIKVDGIKKCPQKLLVGIIEGKPIKEAELPTTGCSN